MADVAHQQRRQLGVKTPPQAVYRGTAWYAGQGGWGTDESQLHHKSGPESQRSDTVFPPKGTSISTHTALNSSCCREY